MYGVMTNGNGLLYMRARFYSPEIRRFVNRDVLLGGIGDGQSLNRFAFVTGQPVRFVDPFGLSGDELGSWLNTTISLTVTTLDLFDTASDIVYACSVVASAGGSLVAAPAQLAKKAAVKKLIKALKEVNLKKILDGIEQNGYKVKINPKNPETKQEVNATIDCVKAIVTI